MINKEVLNATKEELYGIFYYGAKAVIGDHYYIALSPYWEAPGEWQEVTKEVYHFVEATIPVLESIAGNVESLEIECEHSKMFYELWSTVKKIVG